jgi:hypothetical protein
MVQKLRAKSDDVIKTGRSAQLALKLLNRERKRSGNAQEIVIFLVSAQVALENERYLSATSGSAQLALVLGTSGPCFLKELL